MRPLLSPGGFDMGRGVEAIVLFRVSRKAGPPHRTVRLSLDGHDCLTQLAATIRAMRGVYLISLYDTSNYSPAWEVYNGVHARPTLEACKPQKGALSL